MTLVFGGIIASRVARGIHALVVVLASPLTFESALAPVHQARAIGKQIDKLWPPPGGCAADTAGDHEPHPPRIFACCGGNFDQLGFEEIGRSHVHVAISYAVLCWGIRHSNPMS